MIIRSTKINSRYVKGKDQEGAMNLKQFLDQQINSRGLGTQSDRYSPKRDFEQYMEV